MSMPDAQPNSMSAPEPGEPAESHERLMARLYREHNQALVRFLLTRVDSEQEARDIAQEAYVRLLQLHSKGAISFLSGYLFKTAGNIAIDRLRRRGTVRRADNRLARDQRSPAPPEAIVEAREQLELIDRFVQELPSKCRQAFYLHRLQDMSPPEIAAQLGVGVRTVHHYIVQALTHVRLRLDGADEAREDAP